MPINRENVEAYLSGSTSFIARLLPTEALQLKGKEAVFLFEKKLGATYFGYSRSPLGRLPAFSPRVVFD